MMAAVATGLAGCSEAPAPSGQHSDPQAPQDPSPDAVQTDVANASADTADMDAQAQKLFAQLDESLTKLQDQISKLGPQAQEQAELRLAQLRDERDKLLQNYDQSELEKIVAQARSSVAEWSKQANEAIEAANQKLQSAADDASQHVDQAKEKAQQLMNQAKESGLTNPFQTQPESDSPSE